ncbi:MAG: substrate-binding domain-containing protein [Acidobacteriota bacterium]|nr:substrate-binding domain-containing protein [Acidobacteriota bacterium]
MLLLAAVSCAPAQVDRVSYESQVVASYPHYVPQQQVSGVIRVSGHGSASNPWMRQLLTAWEKDLERFQPGIKLEYRMYGTSSAIPALFNGVADIAILGEEIDPVAVRTFERVKHHPPLGIDVFTGSVDIRNIDYAQMFFVNKDNPLARLSLTELDGIFGTEHRRGSTNIRTWGELGLTGEWADKPITPYGWRIDDSFGIFLQQYLMEGSHRWNCDLHEYSHIYRADGTIYDHGQQILDALAKDRYGIAVSNIRYAGPDVKALEIGVTPAGPFYSVSKQTLIDRTYPLSRVIPAVIDRTPGMPVDPKLKEFLRYLLSREGQEIVLHDGRYLPLSAAAAQKEVRKLD